MVTTFTHPNELLTNRNQNEHLLEVSVDDILGALQMVGDGDDVGQSVRVRRGLYANVRIHNYQHVVRTSKSIRTYM